MSTSTPRDADVLLFPDGSVDTGIHDVGVMAADRRDAARRRAAQRRLHRGLVLLLRSRPVSRSRTLATLHAEQETAPVALPVGDRRCTHAESVVLTRGRARAQSTLGRGALMVAWTARRQEWLASVLTAIEGWADGRGRAPVRLGRATVPIETAVGERDYLERMIAGHTMAGARLHQRLPRLLRWAPPGIAAIDLVVLLYFTGVVFDVNPQAPLSLPGLVALAFALLATAVSYAWLTLAGNRLNGYRDRRGEIVWRAVGAATGALLIGVDILVAALAGLMYTRVYAEVVGALPATASPAAESTAHRTGVVMGVVFAVFSTIANLSVVAVHALDGSPATHRSDQLGHALARRRRHLNTLRWVQQQLRHRRDLLARRAERSATRTVTRVNGRLIASEQLIDAARSRHQGRGPITEPIADSEPEAPQGQGPRGHLGAPPTDSRPLTIACQHAQSTVDEPRGSGRHLAQSPAP